MEDTRSSNSFNAIMGRFGRVPRGTRGKSHLVWNAKNTVAYCTFGTSFGRSTPRLVLPIVITLVTQWTSMACHHSISIKQMNKTVSTVSTNEITTGHLIRLRGSASGFWGEGYWFRDHCCHQPFGFREASACCRR